MRRGTGDLGECLDHGPGLIIFIKNPALSLQFVIRRETLITDPRRDLFGCTLDERPPGAAFDEVDRRFHRAEVVLLPLVGGQAEDLLGDGLLALRLELLIDPDVQRVK